MLFWAAISSSVLQISFSHSVCHYLTLLWVPFSPLFQDWLFLVFSVSFHKAYFFLLDLFTIFIFWIENFKFIQKLFPNLLLYLVQNYFWQNNSSITQGSINCLSITLKVAFGSSFFPVYFNRVGFYYSTFSICLPNFF